jgi:hypothetical protein
MFKQLALVAVVLAAISAHAREITVSDSNLGVTVQLNDSRLSAPISAISDDKGTDYKDVVEGINDAIAKQTLHCYEGGISGWINSKAGCKWIGFLPTEAKILPYKTFLPDYKHPDLALVIKGDIQPHEGRSTMTVYIPLQELVEETRFGNPIYWWFSDGGVRSDRDYLFKRVDTNQIFNP